MSRRNDHIHEESIGRDELARAVRSVPKADPKLSTIERIRKIKEEHQANRVDGILVDAYSASVILSIYDAVNDENKRKLASLPVRRMAAICYELTSKRKRS